MPINGLSNDENPSSCGAWWDRDVAACLHQHFGLKLHSSEPDSPLRNDMRHLSNKVVFVIAVIAIAAIFAAATAPAQKPSFEVASVKPSPVQTLAGKEPLYTLRDGRFTADGIILRVLIFYAYGLQTHYQLIGGPDWMDTAHWDI